MKIHASNKILTAIFFAAACLVMPTQSEAIQKELSSEEKFRQLEKDIPSLYLINGLFLSKKQTAELVFLLKEAKSIEDKTQGKIKKIEKKYHRDMGREEEKIIKHISRTGEVDNRKLSKHSDSKRLRSGNKELRELYGEMYTKLDKLTDEAYTLLTASQQDIVKTFKPCFIPDRDFRNPQRVGQAADDTSAGEKALSRLREMPEHKRNEVKKNILDRLAIHMMREHHIKYSDATKQQVEEELSERLEKILPRALALNETDFELQKSTLSEQLLWYGKEDKHSHTAANVVKWKVKTYLLNTGNINALQSRL